MELILNGVMMFNISFVSEPATRTMATKVIHLTVVKLEGTAMSYTDVRHVIPCRHPGKTPEFVDDVCQQLGLGILVGY